MLFTIKNSIVLCVVCFLVAGGAMAWGQGSRGQTFDDGSWARGFDGVESFTKPSADAVMGFTDTTTVTEILVAGGERVKAGQLLVRGEDDEQEAIVKQTRLRVESLLPVQRAKLAADLAKLEYEKMKEAFDRGGATQIQMDRARLTWKTAEIDVELTDFNTMVERARLTQAEALLARYQIRARFDGIVDEVYRDEGSSMDRAQPVVRVVSVDEIQIDVPVPADMTMELKLKVGDRAWVLIDTPGEGTVMRGKVVEVSPLADFASRTRRVRVEAANPDGLPPGLRCWTRFKPPAKDWRGEGHNVGMGG